MVYMREGFARKFEAAWEREDTRQWMNESRTALLASRREMDYAEYTQEQENMLENNICRDLFHTDEAGAQMALDTGSDRKAFSKEQLEIAINIRKSMANVARSPTLRVQSVLVHLRLQENIEKKEKISREYKVFRVATDNPEQPGFVDNAGRCYESWKDFLDNNKLPKSMMAYPKDGIPGTVNNNDEQAEIEFCESASCNWLEETKEVCDTAAVASIFIGPAGYLGFALKGYGIIRSSMSFYDKDQHKEDSSNDQNAVLAQIGMIAVGWIMSNRSNGFRRAALVKNKIPKVRQWLIYGLGAGASLKNLKSTFGLIYQFTKKKDITALDYYYLAGNICNIYSICISLRSLREMVEAVKQELAERATQAEEHKVKMEEQRQIVEKTTQMIEENKEKKRLLKESGEDPDRVQQLRDENKAMKAERGECIKKIEYHKEQHLANSDYQLQEAIEKRQEIEKETADLVEEQKELRKKGNESEAKKLDEKIKDKNTEMETHAKVLQQLQEKGEKIQHELTIQQARQEAVGTNPNAGTYVDEGGKTVQVIVELDIKTVLKYVSETEVKVELGNGETVNLLAETHTDSLVQEGLRARSTWPNNGSSLGQQQDPFEDFFDDLKIENSNSQVLLHHAGASSM